MRIIVHDYSGHPFQVQLSRALARRNHQILHLYSGSFQTPHGSLGKLANDPKGFKCYPVSLPKSFAKYSLIKRRFQEVEYGRMINSEVDKFKPEVLISSNAPLDAQKIILKKCEDQKIKFIYWVQDLYGVGIKNLLSKRYSLLGKVIGSYYQWLELSMLHRSNQIVIITEDFYPFLQNNNIGMNKIHVIHNWAPLEELSINPKDNEWARQQGLHNKICFLYSGTLGLKHNPYLILHLAIKLKDRADVRIVVISEGLGADFLREKKEEFNLTNLVLLPFQQYELLPKILAAADILLAILEKDAGVFSVPSKILTYHCAGRAMLCAVPRNNLSARIVTKNKTGVIVDPNDLEAFIQAAENLLHDKELRKTYGANARKYAENTFDIKSITDKFELILAKQTEDKS
jgi:colanic acid biosynthesis glycosyl transferase WcaI